MEERQRQRRYSTEMLKALFHTHAFAVVGDGAIRGEDLLWALLISAPEALAGCVTAEVDVIARAMTDAGHGKPDLGRSEGTKEAAGSEVPFASDTRRILDRAARIAQQSGHRLVGVEHVSLAFLDEDDGVATRALRAAGLSEQLSMRSAHAREAEYNSSAEGPTATLLIKAPSTE